MQHALTFASRPEHGSVFGVRVPRDTAARRVGHGERPMPLDPIGLRGLHVLCVDNDRSILDGMEALLGQWGITVCKASGTQEALAACAQGGFDALLADYHLGDGIDGIELLQRLSAGSTAAGALISADHDNELQLRARAAGLPLLYKPLRPAALRALLSAFGRRGREASAA
jgi:DNA-binding response OmpR family regulator